MNLRTILQTNNQLVQGSGVGILSLQEYLTSFVNKLTRFTAKTVGDAEEYITVAVTDPNNSLRKVVAEISATDYDSIVNDDTGSISLPVGTSLNMQFNRSDVLEAIEDAMEESTVQNEFLGYVMDSEQPTSTDFFTYVRSRLSGVSSSTIDKYCQYLKGGDGTAALRNFMSSIKRATGRVSGSGDNEYIEILAESTFTGTSVWSIIWTNFTTRIKTLFSKVWEGFSHLFKFFENLFNRIVDLAKWLVFKAFHPLMTNYELTSSRVGIIDLPLAQIPLGQVTFTSNGTPQLSVANVLVYYPDFRHASQAWWVFSSAQPFSLNAMSRLSSLNGISGPYLASDYNSSSDQARYNWYTAYGFNILAGMAFNEDPDGNFYARPFDVFFPLKYDARYPDGPDALVFRLGVDQNNVLWVTTFLSCPKEYVKQNYDRVIYEALRGSFISGLQDMSILYPYWMSTNRQDLIRDDVSWTNGNIALSDLILNKLVTPLSVEEQSEDGPIDVVSHLLAFNVDDILEDTTVPTGCTGFNVSWAFTRLVWNVIVPHIIANGPRPVSIDATAWNETSLSGYTCYGAAQYASGYKFFGAQDVHWTDIDANELGYPSTWAAEYRPYTTSCLSPAIAHYQSLAEQAAELEKYIVAAIIAAAAVAVTIVAVKFRKKRIAKAEIAQGYVDNMSWNLSQNPTKEDMQKYLQAKKVAKKVRKHNALLGISTPADTAADTISVVQSVRDQLYATQGVNLDDQTIDSIDLLTLGRLINHNV